MNHTVILGNGYVEEECVAKVLLFFETDKSHEEPSVKEIALQLRDFFIRSARKRFKGSTRKCCQEFKHALGYNFCPTCGSSLEDLSLENLEDEIALAAKDLFEDFFHATNNEIGELYEDLFEEGFQITSEIKSSVVMSIPSFGRFIEDPDFPCDFEKWAVVRVAS